MSMRTACPITFALTMLSCHAANPHAPPEPPPRVLPDVPGFTGGPEERGPAYVRRTYAHGPENTTVTLARFPMSDRQYEDWLRMSTADYPQAPLEVGPGEGNGFYQCAPDDPSRCNLLVQLRCGVHLEIRGQGVARRADADAVLRGLGLGSLELARLESSTGSFAEWLLWQPVPN
jgi:hypothetical protein